VTPPSPPEPPPLPTPPAPLPQQISDQWKGVYWSPSTYLRGHLFVHAVAFYAVAASMWLQPDRYNADQWRGLQFIVTWAPPRTWALVFAFIATCKFVAGVIYPRLARPIMVLCLIVVTWWVVGFAFAWVDSDATILPMVLAVLDAGEHVAALTMLDGRRRWRP
jgi:hypothetical protein